LKSVVSYQVNGSRYVPLAGSGISDSEVPDKLDGEEPPFEELDFELFFFTTTTATGIIIARSRSKMPRHIPSQDS
jgi:hypothetical protein